MRKLVLFLGATLCLSGLAKAQDRIVSFAAPSPAAASPQFFGGEATQWQLAVGYQYNSIKLGSSRFNTNGFNTSIVRFFGNTFGLEAQVGAGFGNTGTTTSPSNLTAKSVFVGGGPHIAYRGQSRLEPWVHAIVGLEHFRFTQTAGQLGSNNAFAYTLGGGVDIGLNGFVALRAEGDYLGTRFFSGNQSNFQAIGGLVFNF
jgi:opacity protein-like surface antigen